MIVCYIAPAVRVIRRAIVARPRVSVVGAAAAATARRVVRTAASQPALVCRDLGALALATSLGGAAPLVPLDRGGLAPAGFGAAATAGYIAGVSSGQNGFTPASLGGGYPTTREPITLPPGTALPMLSPNTLLVPPDLLFNPPRVHGVPPDVTADAPSDLPPSGPLGRRGAPPVSVPEPSSLTVVLAAVTAFLLFRRRRA